MNYSPPNSDVVVDELRRMGGRSTAKSLCDALVGKGIARRDAQLAIQRTTSSGGIELETDWTVSVRSP